MQSSRHAAPSPVPPPISPPWTAQDLVIQLGRARTAPSPEIVREIVLRTEADALSFTEWMWLLFDLLTSAPRLSPKAVEPLFRAGPGLDGLGSGAIWFMSDKADKMLRAGNKEPAVRVVELLYERCKTGRKAMDDAERRRYMFYTSGLACSLKDERLVTLAEKWRHVRTCGGGGAVEKYAAVEKTPPVRGHKRMKFRSTTVPSAMPWEGTFGIVAVAVIFLVVIAIMTVRAWRKEGGA